MQMIAAADIFLCLIIAAPNAITSVFRLGAKNHGTFKRALGSSQMRQLSGRRGPVCEYAKPKRRCNQRAVCRSRSTPARGQLEFHFSTSQSVKRQKQRAVALPHLKSVSVQALLLFITLNLLQNHACRFFKSKSSRLCFEQSFLLEQKKGQKMMKFVHFLW